MNENKFEIFNSAEFGSVRTLETNEGKVLFCGKDVANALDYRDTAYAISTHCKGVGEIPTPTAGGIQMMKFITEGDLYRLIAHSKLPTAERFEGWVFDEVLPTIRKHGAYMTDITLEKALTSPDFLIQLAIQLKSEKEQRIQLETVLAVQEQRISELKPKADYTDRILSSRGLVTITQIAKDYGMSGSEMNKKLHELGVQYKQSSQWLLYVKYQGRGYTHSETVEIVYPDGTSGIRMNTKWTQKGRLFLYNLLRENGVIPCIEMFASQSKSNRQQ